MKKIRVWFRVKPSYLIQTYVQDPVEIRILKPNHPFLKDFLGDTGKKLAKAGAVFEFERALAELLIREGIAEKVEVLK